MDSCLLSMLYNNLLPQNKYFLTFKHPVKTD